MFYIPLDSEGDSTFNGRTLIVTFPTVGNVGQLAVDLVLSTLLRSNQVRHVGAIDSDGLRCVTGSNPFAMDGELMTAAQVYDSAEKNLTIAQIRSPCFREAKADFLNELVQWIQSSGFARVFILSSSFSQTLSDVPLDECIASPIRYLSFSKSTENQCPLTAALPHMRKVQKVERFTLKPMADESDGNGIVHLPGSGLTRKLFAELEKISIDCTVLIKYCSEGDNTQDAFHLAETINAVVHAVEPSKSTGRVSWDVPISWSAMFGSAAPNGVY